MDTIIRIAIYICFILLPILFWLIFIKWQDKGNPEPRKLLITLFLLGIGVALLGTVLELFVMFPFLGGQDFGEIVEKAGEFDATAIKLTRIIFVTAAVIEELLKFAVLRLYIYKKKEFDQMKDGIFYGFTLSLGFVLIENTLYFFNASEQGLSALFTISFIRGVMTAMLHITTAGIIGLSLGKMKFSQKHSSLWVYLAVISALVIHAIFNLATLVPYGVFIDFPLTFGGIIFLIWQMNRKESKIIWTLVEPGKNGPLPPLVATKK